MGPRRVSGIVQDRVGCCRGTVRRGRANAVLVINSNVTETDKLMGYVSKRLLRFRSKDFNVTRGLRRGDISVMVFNSSRGVNRNRAMGHANGIISMPMNSTVIKHIMGTLKRPVSKTNPVSAGRFQPVRDGTPKVYREESMCRPLRANVGTVSSVVPVKHKRQRLVVNSHRANGAAVTASAVVGRGKGSIVYVCMTVKRGHSAMTALMRGLAEGNTVSCAVIITTATSRSDPLRCVTPCSKYTVNRCFVGGKGSILVVCSSLDGRTITCHTLSLLVHHPPKHRTCPNSIFCLRSELLRHTTGLSSRRNNNSVATLPVVRARTNSMSTCVPAGIVSVASKRVFLRARLFRSKVVPTMGPNVSMSQINNSTRVGTVGGMTKALGLVCSRCHRLRDFTRFNSSLSTSAGTHLRRKTHVIRILGRGRGTPIPMRGRITVLCTIAGNILRSMGIRSMGMCRSKLCACLSASTTNMRIVRRVHSANGLRRRARRGLHDMLSTCARGFLGAEPRGWDS